MTEINPNAGAETSKATGDWAIRSRRLKEKLVQLIDPDLKPGSGKENELFSRIESRLSQKRDEMISMIRKREKPAL